MFWEEWQWNDGGESFFYFPAAGELRIETPPIVQGGLLCEEMGLGKTLEIIALILDSKQKSNNLMDIDDEDEKDQEKEIKKEKEAEADDEADAEADETYKKSKKTKKVIPPLPKSKSTLIIVPQTLAGQWESEIKKSTLPNVLSMVCHMSKLHGRVLATDPASMTSMNAASKLKIRRTHLTQHYDIVLTTYQMLKADKQTFNKVEWFRICLDEMQEIRSSTTELARLCKNLVSPKRWMISGTPIFDGIDDLNGELNFLGVQPFCLNDAQDGFWGRRIRSPWEARDPNARNLLLELLSCSMMRHSKAQQTIDGRPLLELPKSTHRFIGVNFEDTARGRANLYIGARMESLLCDVINELKNQANYISGRDARSVTNNGRVVKLLKLIRSGYISLNLINGGTGCVSQMRELNVLFRRAIHGAAGAAVFNMGGGALGADFSVAKAEDIPLLKAEEAMCELTKARDRVQSAREIESGMVRSGGNANQQNSYSSGRTYAMESVTEKFAAAIGQLKSQYVDGEIPLTRIVARTRWQYAFESITSGYYGALVHESGVVARDANYEEEEEPFSHTTAIGKKQREYSRMMNSVNTMKNQIDHVKKYFTTASLTSIVASLTQKKYIESVQNDLNKSLSLMKDTKERAVNAMNIVSTAMYHEKMCLFNMEERFEAKKTISSSIDNWLLKNTKKKKKKIVQAKMYKVEEMTNQDLHKLIQTKGKRKDLMSLLNRSCFISFQVGKIRNEIPTLNDDDFDAVLTFKQEYEYSLELTTILSKIPNESNPSSSSSSSSNSSNSSSNEQSIIVQSPAKEHVRRHLKALQKICRSREKFLLDNGPEGWRSQGIYINEHLWQGKREIIKLEEFQVECQIKNLCVLASNIKQAVEEGDYHKIPELKTNFQEAIVNYVTFQKQESENQEKHMRDRAINAPMYRKKEMVKRKYATHRGIPEITMTINSQSIQEKLNEIVLQGSITGILLLSLGPSATTSVVVQKDMQTPPTIGTFNTTTDLIIGKTTVAASNIVKTERTDKNGCGKTVAHVFTRSKLLLRSKLLKDLKSDRHSLNLAKQKLSKLVPYLNRLAKAIENEHKKNQEHNDNNSNSSSSSSSNSSSNSSNSSSSSSSSSSNNNGSNGSNNLGMGGVVEHSGFQALQAIMQYDKTDERYPKCSICLEPVSDPTFTRCVHLACAECFITWLQAAPLVDEGARAQEERHAAALLRHTGNNEAERARLIARESRAPCMLCRQPFSISQLIRVDPNEAKKANDEARNGSKSKKKRNDQNDDDQTDPSDTSAIWKDLYDPIALIADFVPPKCAPQYNDDIVGDIPSVSQGFVLRSPIFPCLDALFLTQLNVALGIPANASTKMTSKTHRSPKIMALLKVLRPIMKSNNGEGKVVVFSQNKMAIAHVSMILKQEKIGSVKIVRGDPPKSQTEAVQIWNTDPTIPIFLLHAGTAAAGLTLTAASHVVLLEPFNSRGEEQQALNRTHRIGQTQDVVCTTLYCRNTVEERILAYRNLITNGNDENSSDLTVLTQDNNSSSAADNDQELEYILGLNQ